LFWRREANIRIQPQDCGPGTRLSWTTPWRTRKRVSGYVCACVDEKTGRKNPYTHAHDLARVRAHTRILLCKERIKPLRVHRRRRRRRRAGTGIVFNPLPWKQERPLNNRSRGGQRERESNGSSHRPSISERAAPPKLFRSTLKAFRSYSHCGQGKAERGIYMNFAFERIGYSKYAY